MNSSSNIEPQRNPNVDAPLTYEKDSAGNVTGNGKIEVNGKFYIVTFSLGSVDGKVDVLFKETFENKLKELIQEYRTNLETGESIQISKDLNDTHVSKINGLGQVDVDSIDENIIERTINIMKNIFTDTQGEIFFNKDKEHEEKDRLLQKNINKSLRLSENRSNQLENIITERSVEE